MSNRHQQMRQLVSGPVCAVRAGRLFALAVDRLASTSSSLDCWRVFSLPRFTQQHAFASARVEWTERHPSETQQMFSLNIQGSQQAACVDVFAPFGANDKVTF